METDTIYDEKVHHGHNIRYARKRKGISQEEMAEKVNMSQQTVSRYESMGLIDDEILCRFAEALEVPVEYFKTREEGSPSIMFEGNSFENNASIVGSIGEDHSTLHFNPVEKIVELYERLLKAEKERNESLEKRLVALEQKAGK